MVTQLILNFSTRCMWVWIWYLELSGGKSIIISGSGRLGYLEISCYVMNVQLCIAVRFGNSFHFCQWPVSSTWMNQWNVWSRWSNYFTCFFNSGNSVAVCTCTTSTGKDVPSISHISIFFFRKNRQYFKFKYNPLQNRWLRNQKERSKFIGIESNILKF